VTLGGPPALAARSNMAPVNQLEEMGQKSSKLEEVGQKSSKPVSKEMALKP